MVFKVVGRDVPVSEQRHALESYRGKSKPHNLLLL